MLWTKLNANYIYLEPWSGVQDIAGSDYDFTIKEGIIWLDSGKKFAFIHIIECFE